MPMRTKKTRKIVHKDHPLQLFFYDDWQIRLAFRDLNALEGNEAEKFLCHLGPREEEELTDTEKVLIKEKEEVAREHERLLSKEREQNRHNKASRDMVMWDADAGEDIIRKLAKHKRRYVKVLQDGDCMFSSILCGIHIHNDEYSAFDLRRQVAMYLLSHRHEMYDELEPYLLADEIGYRRYVSNLVNDHLWGDAGVLMTVSHMWNVGLAVHTVETKTPLLYGCSDPKDAWIHLVYNMANHYSGSESIQNTVLASLRAKMGPYGKDREPDDPREKTELGLDVSDMSQDEDAHMIMTVGFKAVKEVTLQEEEVPKKHRSRGKARKPSSAAGHPGDKPTEAGEPGEPVAPKKSQPKRPKRPAAKKPASAAARPGDKPIEAGEPGTPEKSQPKRPKKPAARKPAKKPGRERDNGDGDDGQRRGSRKSQEEWKELYKKHARGKRRAGKHLTREEKEEISGDSSSTPDEEELGKRWTNDGKRDLTCPRCPHRGPFCNFTSLRDHYRRRHLHQVIYQCTICHKAFGKRSTLNSHMRNHRMTDEQRAELACPKDGCKCIFDTPAQLKGHLSSAHRRWRCPHPPCTTEGKSFSRKSDLRFHVKTVHVANQQPVQCPKCKKQLKHSKSLKIHEDKCRGIYKRQCDICGQRLANSVEVANHQKMHQRELLREEAAEASKLERERQEKERKGRDKENEGDDNGDE